MEMKQSDRSNNNNNNNNDDDDNDTTNYRMEKNTITENRASGNRLTLEVNHVLSHSYTNSGIETENKTNLLNDDVGTLQSSHLECKNDQRERKNSIPTQETEDLPRREGTDQLHPESADEKRPESIDLTRDSGDETSTHSSEQSNSGGSSSTEAPSNFVNDFLAMDFTANNIFQVSKSNWNFAKRDQDKVEMGQFLDSRLLAGMYLYIRFRSFNFILLYYQSPFLVIS